MNWPAAKRGHTEINHLNPAGLYLESSAADPVFAAMTDYSALQD